MRSAKKISDAKKYQRRLENDRDRKRRAKKREEEAKQQSSLPTKDADIIPITSGPQKRGTVADDDNEHLTPPRMGQDEADYWKQKLLATKTELKSMKKTIESQTRVIENQSATNRTMSETSKVMSETNKVMSETSKVMSEDVGKALDNTAKMIVVSEIQANNIAKANDNTTRIVDVLLQQLNSKNRSGLNIVDLVNMNMKPSEPDQPSAKTMANPSASECDAKPSVEASFDKEFSIAMSPTRKLSFDGAEKPAECLMALDGPLMPNTTSPTGVEWDSLSSEIESLPTKPRVAGEDHEAEEASLSLQPTGAPSPEAVKRATVDFRDKLSHDDPANDTDNRVPVDHDYFRSKLFENRVELSKNQGKDGMEKYELTLRGLESVGGKEKLPAAILVRNHETAVHAVVDSLRQVKAGKTAEDPPTLGKNILVLQETSDWKKASYVYFGEIDHMACGGGQDEMMDMHDFMSFGLRFFCHEKVHVISVTFPTSDDESETTIAIHIATYVAPHASDILSALIVGLSRSDLGITEVALTSSARDSNNLPNLFVEADSLKTLVGTPITFVLDHFSLLDEDEAALAHRCRAKLKFQKCTFSADGGFILLSGGEHNDGEFPLDLVFEEGFPSFQHLTMAIGNNFVRSLEVSVDGNNYDLSARDFEYIQQLVSQAAKQGHKIKWGDECFGDFDERLTTVSFKSCFTCLAASGSGMGTGTRDVREAVHEAWKASTKPSKSNEASTKTITEPSANEPNAEAEPGDDHLASPEKPAECLMTLEAPLIPSTPFTAQDQKVMADIARVPSPPPSDEVVDFAPLPMDAAAMPRDEGPALAEEEREDSKPAAAAPAAASGTTEGSLVLESASPTALKSAAAVFSMPEGVEFITVDCHGSLELVVGRAINAVYGKQALCFLGKDCEVLIFHYDNRFYDVDMFPISQYKTGEGSFWSDSVSFFVAGKTEVHQESVLALTKVIHSLKDQKLPALQQVEAAGGASFAGEGSSISKAVAPNEPPALAEEEQVAPPIKNLPPESSLSGAIDNEMPSKFKLAVNAEEGSTFATAPSGDPAPNCKPSGAQLASHVSPTNVGFASPAAVVGTPVASPLSRHEAASTLSGSNDDNATVTAGHAAVEATPVANRRPRTPAASLRRGTPAGSLRRSSRKSTFDGHYPK